MLSVEMKSLEQERKFVNINSELNCKLRTSIISNRPNESFIIENFIQNLMNVSRHVSRAWETFASSI